MNYERPIVLTIAGHDPSGGAGLNADLKVFEQHKVYGFSVCTANTVQTDKEFFDINWVDADVVKKQLETLLQNFSIDFFKIGIIESAQLLKEVVAMIRSYCFEAKIIWDPILSASAGNPFHDSLEELRKVAVEVDLLTPNLVEVEKIFNNDIPGEVAVLVKGGHSKGINATDVLFQNGRKIEIKGIRYTNYDKHGTGCILSSAILSNWALGFSLEEACRKGKEYLSNALISNTELLAYHKQD